MRKYLLGIGSLSLIFLLFSCGEVIPTNSITAPATYDFNRSGISSVEFSGQTTRLEMADELVNAMLDFDQNIESLIEMYTNQTFDGSDANPFENENLNNSTKSIKSKVAASADYFSTNTIESSEIKSTIQSWITLQTLEVFPMENQMASIGKAGQIADGSSVRYINAKGLEYNQAVAKSLIGALMLDQICNNYLSPAVLDANNNLIENNNEVLVDGKSYTSMEHKWDEAYGYIFAQSVDYTSPLSTANNDKFLLKYIQKVDNDSDFTGILSEIYHAFKLGRAAIVGKDYVLRDQQAEIIKEKLSQVIAIRAVHYLQNGMKALSNGDFGGAFHDLSEGLGFVYSLRFTRKMNSDQSYFTSQEIKMYTDAMLAENGFWDIDSLTLTSISESIAAKFDFTVAQTSE